MRMLDAKKIKMGLHEDRSRLTTAQRQAALKVGRSEMHLVSMDG